MSSQRSGVAIAGAAFGLALGTVFGAYVLGPHSGASGSVSQHNSSLQQQVDTANSERNQANKSLQAADSLGKSMAPSAVEGRLTGKSVLLITTPSADKGDVDAVKSLIEPAGGTVTGTITLTDKFVSRDGAEKLKTIAANTLPAGVHLSEEQSRPGSHIGQLMGGAFVKSKATDGHEAADQSTGPERSIVHDALVQGGFISTDGDLDPADVVIVITGGDNGKDNNDYPAELISDFAQGLKTNGNGVVLASRTGAATDDGAVARVRDNSSADVSTVDDVDHVTGQVSAIRAAAKEIAGESGSYGVSNGVQKAVAD